MELLHSEVTDKIVGTFFSVYNELGIGFPEFVYCRAMGVALRSAGLRVGEDVRLPVWFRGMVLVTFKADLVVLDGPVIVEIKAGADFESYQEVQLMGYLRATDVEVGLLLNFGRKARFKRFVFGNDRKRPREDQGRGTT